MLVPIPPMQMVIMYDAESSSALKLSTCAQFLAFRLQEVAAERDALSTDLRKTKVQPLPSCCSLCCAEPFAISRWEGEQQ